MARSNETSDLIAVLQIMEPAGRPLVGMRICVTGHLSRVRSEWQDLIKAAGGENHDSVKYDTTHLCSNEDWSRGVLGEGNKVSSKYRKAQQYRIPVISEQALLALIIKADSESRDP